MWWQILLVNLVKKEEERRRTHSSQTIISWIIIFLSHFQHKNNNEKHQQMWRYYLCIWGGLRACHSTFYFPAKTISYLLFIIIIISQFDAAHTHRHFFSFSLSAVCLFHSFSTYLYVFTFLLDCHRLIIIVAVVVLLCIVFHKISFGKNATTHTFDGADGWFLCNIFLLKYYPDNHERIDGNNHNN